MARPTIEFKQSKSKQLILEIQSNLQSIELKSIDPFWEVLERSGLEGEFLLVITKKVQGAHEQGPIVKIVGLASAIFLVSVKFQCSSEFCYEGTLSGKKNGAEGRSTIPASIINQELQKIAGTAWYDPSKVGAKKQSLSMPSAPLVSVGVAVRSAIAPVSRHVETRTHAELPATRQSIAIEAAAPQSSKQLVNGSDPQSSKKDTRGLSRDFTFVRSVLEEVAKKAVSGEVTSIEISEAIVKFSNQGGDMSRKACSPIMTAWVDKGWLKRRTEIGTTPARFSITDKAVDELKINIDSSSRSTIPRIDCPAVTTLGQSTHTDLVQTLGFVERKAREFVEARNKADELELQKMQLEDDLKSVQKELEALRPILEDPESRKAAELLSVLSSFKQAPVSA